MKGPFVIRSDGEAIIVEDAQEALKTATHLAITKHVSVSIFAHVKTIRIESKIITTDNDGLESEVVV